ncbi:predicted protein, partial [Arabidopsis lyrata subsp. lyrata]
LSPIFYNTLQGVLNFQRGFQPQDTDIILASFPKSGTTWLKALTVALLERLKNRSSNDHHLLLSDNPHGIVPFFEIDMYNESLSPDLVNFSSFPRLFSTHMPLHAMHETLKESPCKIVYIKICSGLCLNRFAAELSIIYGPFWEHLLSYWRESLENPNHVLFMRYEEMKAKPRDQIKRLADFLDCPFTKEEEEKGSVDEILNFCSGAEGMHNYRGQLPLIFWLRHCFCSLRNLSSLEVNKTQKTNNVDHKNYFRKGEVGDWKNYLTPEMESKIDMVIQEKLQGSGLKF